MIWLQQSIISKIVDSAFLISAGLNRCRKVRSLLKGLGDSSLMNASSLIAGVCLMGGIPAE